MCRLWKSQADIVLHQRKQFCWQLFEGDTGDGYYVPGHSVVWNSIQQFFEVIDQMYTSSCTFDIQQFCNGFTVVVLKKKEVQL